MLKLRVIPCLDVKDGRIVKGVNFAGLRDAGDSVEQAAVYDAAGADKLTFLNITSTATIGKKLDDLWHHVVNCPARRPTSDLDSIVRLIDKIRVLQSCCPTRRRVPRLH